MSKTLAQLRSDRRVEHVDDERALGHGVILMLRQGWTFDPLQDNRVAGEDSPSAALRLLRSAQPYAGPFDD